jgi:hypothetical protein
MQENSKTARRITNKPTVEQLQTDFNAAKPSHDEQVAKVSNWLAILEANDVDTSRFRPNKSKVKPKLARKQAEWRYAVISEPFLSTDDIFSVKPRGALDRRAAYQNGLVLNYQLNNLMNKTKFIDSFTRTGINEGTAIAKVCWKSEYKDHKITVPTFEATEPNNLQMDLIIKNLEKYMLDPNAVFSMGVETAESVMKSAETGNPVWMRQTGTEEITKRIYQYNQPDLEICDYRNVIIDPTCDGDVTNAEFIIYSYETNLSSLHKAGIYENLDELDIENLNNYSNGDHTNVSRDDSFNFTDAARKKFTVYEYWGYWDLYGTGETVPIIATWANGSDVLIRCEESPYPFTRLPFVVVPYLPIKNSVYGEPDAELIADEQKILGALTRAFIDTFSATANGQKGFAKGALDFVNRQRMERGETFDFNPNGTPDATVWQSKMQELPVTAMNFYQMINNEASAMTGIQPFGVTAGMAGDTAAGINSYVSAQGKREFGILRRFTQGMKEIAEMIMAMNAEWLTDDEIIRITDEDFVQINRENLRGNFDVILSVSTQEMDAVKAQQLAFMLQTLGNTVPFELTKVGFEEIALLNRMPDLAKKIRDYEPQPDPVQQMEMQKLQIELQKSQLELAEVQARTQNIAADTQLKVAKAEETTSKKDNLDLDYIHKEKGVDHARDMELQQAQAEGNTKRDAFNAALRLKENQLTSNTSKGN